MHQNDFSQETFIFHITVDNQPQIAASQGLIAEHVKHVDMGCIPCYMGDMVLHGLYNM